ncbi:autotransporter outer membrane beta-barrel domain-containing protein [Pandoraea anhela]|uniref:Putative autotransporter n=1 Tax=Pandoraea anhela TaxID=2508295 RepID=A0A5E4T7J5_9BURK|nr:autotransporter outer membrane beta-barrel domain-containing protein [Pandoraea anhela]VVD83441.1 putative autotransporter [Pandoraea anhela]
MPTSHVFAPRQRIMASAIALALTSLAVSAQADTVDGSTRTVTAPGNPNETYTVFNGGKLTLQSGTSTNWIYLDGTVTPARGASHLRADGATIIGSMLSGGTLVAALRILNSDATINNSTITSTTQAGVALTGQVGSGLVAPTATITNSTISGNQFGASVSSNGILTLNNSDVSAGTGAVAGLNGGVANFDSTVVVNGGKISGNLSGVLAATSNLGNTNSLTTINGATVTAANGAAILAEPGRNAGAFFGHTANILVQNGSTLTGSNGFAIQALGQITANATIDNSNITGNVGSDGTATLNLTLQNNATLTGDLQNLNTLAVNAGATWRLVTASTVGTTTMNGGTIDIPGAAAGTGTYRTLTLGSLSGKGNFLMGVGFPAHTADVINVTGNAAGSYQLSIPSTGQEPTDLSPLTVVKTGGGDATFAVKSIKVDAGTRTYLLAKQGNNWALVTDTNQGIDEVPTDGGGTDGGTGGGGGGGDSGSPPVGGELSPSAQLVLGISSAGPTVWYGEEAILRTRLGELRMGDQSNTGVWARTFGKQYHAKPTNSADYRQTQYGVIGGADGVVGEAWGGKWLVGAMMGTSHSKLTFDNGSTGGVNSYTAGLYATWLSAAGWYFDGVVKYNHFQNDANAIMSDGVGAIGSFNNNGVGMTLEFGRHLEFGNRWFIEPYVQTSMLRVGGDSFTLSNGMTSTTSSTGSVQLRVGAALGKTFELAGGMVQPYLKLAVVQEFIKSNQTNINGIVFNNDISGTRVEFGAGVAGQVRRNLQLYAELETSTGRRINQPWGAQVGVRYTF